MESVVEAEAVVVEGGAAVAVLVVVERGDDEEIEAADATEDGWAEATEVTADVGAVEGVVERDDDLTAAS